MSEYVRQLNDESLRSLVEAMPTEVEAVYDTPQTGYLKIAGVRADLLANEIVDRLNELDELREKVKQSQQELLLDALTKLGQEIRT